MEKRYQVFISSTFDDLKDERQAVLKSILELNHMPAGMELFPASDDTAWQLICDVIDSSDYYVLIIGGRDGSLDETGICSIEKAYDYATSNKKPVISLLHSDTDNLPRGKSEVDDNAWHKLKEFRSKVEKNHACKYWRNAQELKVQVVLGLVEAIKRSPAQGWIRAGLLTSEEATHEIISLQKLVSKQQKELKRINSYPPIGAEKLARGDDTYPIKISTTLKKKGAQPGEPERTIRDSRSVFVTWDKIFGILAPVIINPTRETKMKATIVKRLRKIVSNDILHKNADCKISQVSITETLFQTIKVQFLALGLIESGLEIKDDDSQKEIPTCKLTSLGKQHMIKVNAIARN